MDYNRAMVRLFQQKSDNEYVSQVLVSRLHGYKDSLVEEITKKIVYINRIVNKCM